MNKRIIIVGAFIEIVELAEENNCQIHGYFDNTKTGEYLGYPVLGSDENSEEFFSSYLDIPLLITPDKPTIREKLYTQYSKLGFSFTELISKYSKISKSAIISNGSIIQSFVNISSESQIGKFVKLNTGCNIMHNSTIGDFTTVAPNAVILGNVSVGKSCYIGSNSTILPNLRIVDNVVIGAGAVITKNIYEPGIYVGCPAKRMK